MKESEALDPIWDEKYAAGHEQRYPWDVVVSFVFRYAPRDIPKAEVRILEVGCGTGANLRFAAREGFRVCGVDGSQHAIQRALNRFEEEGLDGDLRVGNFTKLDFEDRRFDLVIDRAALTCCGYSSMQAALNEILRVLKPGGRLLFNPYCDSHSASRLGKPGEDGAVRSISEGALANAGQIYFVSRREIDRLFASGWRLLSIQRLELLDMHIPNGHLHSEWRVVAEKV